MEMAGETWCRKMAPLERGLLVVAPFHLFDTAAASGDEVFSLTQAGPAPCDVGGGRSPEGGRGASMGLLGSRGISCTFYFRVWLQNLPTLSLLGLRVNIRGGWVAVQT